MIQINLKLPLPNLEWGFAVHQSHLELTNPITKTDLQYGKLISILFSKTLLCNYFFNFQIKLYSLKLNNFKIEYFIAIKSGLVKVTKPQGQRRRQKCIRQRYNMSLSKAPSSVLGKGIQRAIPYGQWRHQKRTGQMYNTS